MCHNQSEQQQAWLKFTLEPLGLLTSSLSCKKTTVRFARLTPPLHSLHPREEKSFRPAFVKQIAATAACSSSSIIFIDRLQTEVMSCLGPIEKKEERHLDRQVSLCMPRTHF